jgi:plastocyanin
MAELSTISLTVLLLFQSITTHATATLQSAMTMANSTPSSTAPHATHTVKVGPKENPHQYVPHNITAAVGDVIVFEFYPRNHSVVKADFMAPCVPAAGGIFYSGEFNTFNENSDGQLEGEVSVSLHIDTSTNCLASYMVPSRE